MTLDEYQQQAQALFDALQSHDVNAAWRFKWLHPRFRDKTIDAIEPAELTLDDARMVIARDDAFDTWNDLAAFAAAPDAEFEAAAEAVVNGDVETLSSMLRANPALVHARSARSHHATLLHYIGANGVEDARQKTPPNAVEVATLLLDAGAEPDALADMYGSKCTTMSMLVSSSHPAAAGVQLALAELLLDRGAACNGPGDKWQSVVLAALIFSFRETAEGLSKRCPPSDIVTLAGLGRAAEVERVLPQADAAQRHAALAIAAQLGHAEVVKLLLDAGEDPNRYNPPGFHAHATPLHQAVWTGQLDVVRLLVARGARLDIKDTIYRATPLGWAEYGKQDEIAEYLRSLSS
jgi:ankyrin repeat protein